MATFIFILWIFAVIVLIVLLARAVADWAKTVPAPTHCVAGDDYDVSDVYSLDLRNLSHD